MLTYADHIATVWASLQRRAMLAEDRVPPSDTMQLFREAVHDALAYAKATDLNRDDSEFGEIAWFSRFIAPFAGYDEEKPALAITLDRGIDFDLREPDESIQQCAHDVVAEHGTVYIDFPEGEYMLPGNVFQVRALFIRKFPEDNRFCAILTRPGSNHGWRFAWREGRHQRSQYHRVFDNVWAMPSPDICDRYRPINPRKIDYNEFAEVERVAWAALSQWRNTNEAEPVVELVRPAETRERAMDVGGLPIAQDEEFTIFKKVRLHRIRIGAPRITEPKKRRSTSRKPMAKHNVSGHLRWQRHGPKNSLRKHIWVDGFSKGSAPRKTPLNSVRPNFG